MIYSGSLSADLTKREERNYDLALKLATEGMVLLKNDAILPLTNSNIVLYGLGARYTCFGGTGSGEVRSRYKISIYDGLVKCGFKILNTSYLDELDQLVKAERSKWEVELKEGIKKTKLSNILDYAGAHPFVFKGHLPISDLENTDTAIYVLRREAGEGADRKLVEGDMYLTIEEKADLIKLKELYSKLVVVINSPGVIDDIDSISADAIIYTGLGGMMLGEALGLVLNGRAYPSGHLAVTWAKREIYPITYSYDKPLNDDYTDGIFVGYRYFTTFNKPVIYPFGYGLSYTKFVVTYQNIKIVDSKIMVTFTVKNSGNYAGKEVVGLYLTTPNLKGEKVQLVGFAKSPELKPQESVEVSVSFDILDFAAFRDQSYQLEAGKYLLSYGLDVTKLEPLCYLNLDNNIVVEKVKPFIKEAIKTLEANYTLASLDLPSYNLNISSNPIEPTYELLDIKLTKPAQAIYDKLSVKDKIHLLVGSSYLGRPYYKTFGAAGNTSAKFKKYGLYNLVLADGPQGLNLAKESLKPIFKGFNIPVLPEALYLTNIGKLLTIRKIKKDGKQAVYHQFTTNFPSASVIAQTFNLALVEEEGKAIREEMLLYHVNFLLAPGINIVRDPLGGRNYEYYSEDPYLSGILAISLAKGVESPNTHITLKHFCVNNRENCRNQISSNLDEKTLRDIYLKPFKLAITKGKVGAVMSSYNKLNHIHTANSYNLLTAILRLEWHFKGVVMTDWFATGHDDSSHEEAIKAGTNLIMPGLPKIRKLLYKAYKNNQIDLATINYLVKEILQIAIV